MKKAFLVLLALLLGFSVFAETQSSTEASSLTDTSFVVKAFYKGAVTTSVSMLITDYSGNRLYNNTDAEATDAMHVGSEGKIFDWKLTGTATTSLTVKFTFTTLQAKIGNTYYRPGYTMVMYQNPTTSQSGRELYDSMYSSSSQSVGTYTKANRSSTYSDTKTVTYQGQVPASGANYSTSSGTGYGYGWGSSSTSTQITYEYWVKTGNCKLNITDYEDSAAGSYEYRCSVTVEFTTP